MKKLSIITTLLIGSLLLTGCSFHLSVNTNKDTPEENKTIEENNTKTVFNNDVERLMACNDQVGFYLNTDAFNASWDVEEEAGASFVLNGHVTREEDGNVAEDDVECVVDMVDGSVTVEFFNHMYNGELQETVIDEEETVSDAPVAKMRVLEGETAEETMERVEEACRNMGGEEIDGACTLEDGSTIYF